MQIDELPKLYQLFQSGNCKLVFELLEGLNIDKIDFLEMVFKTYKVLDDKNNMFTCWFIEEDPVSVVLNLKYVDYKPRYDLWIDDCSWHTKLTDENNAYNYFYQREYPDWQLRDFLKIIIDEINNNR